MRQRACPNGEFVRGTRSLRNEGKSLTMADDMVALLTKTLGVVCPSCDFLNVVGAVRCMACGTATDGVTTSPATPRVEAQRPAPVEHEAETTMPAATAPREPPATMPPGLKRSSSSATNTSPQHTPQAPTTNTSPVHIPQAPPSPATARGPSRPTFQSSTTPPPQPSPGPRFGLTVLAGPARGQRFRLTATGAQVGRSRGGILFPEDPFISPTHATLVVRDGKLFVRDEASTSGVYVSVNGQETIPVGGAFSTGLRLFRYVGALAPEPAWNRSDVLVYGAPLPNGQVHYGIEEVLLGDRGGRCVLTPGPVLTIGQGRCDFSFANDEGLTPRHCEVAPMPDGAMIRDLSGGLGTYVRISGERALKAGDRLRVGQQTLQVEALG
jgi:pSer/pThr/pTyr-binding forkhead associated (FHA) protein